MLANAIIYDTDDSGAAKALVDHITTASKEVPKPIICRPERTRNLPSVISGERAKEVHAAVLRYPGRATRRYQAVYSEVTSSPYDVIVHFFEGESVEMTAANFEFAVRALQAAPKRLTSPLSIDHLNRIGYDCIADEFTDERRPTTADFHTLSLSCFQQVIEAHGIQGSRVLEIGVGSGWLRRAISWPKAITYLGVDISPRMCLNNKRESVLCATARGLPIESQSVDLVAASLADPFLYLAALLEIRRVLRRGGMFVYSAPSRIWSSSVREAHRLDRTAFTLRSGKDTEVFSFTFDHEDTKLMLGHAGFDIREFSSITPAKLAPRVPAPAIQAAAARHGIPISELPVIDFVKAVRLL